MNIVAVCGSVQQTSSNRALLEELARLAEPPASVLVTDPVDTLPHFNPDLTEPPPSVERFRSTLGAADAAVIATPEYAHNLPGVLKNALDWIVGSGELYATPVAVLCATPRHGGGAMARASLEQTLLAVGAVVVDSRSVLIHQANDRADELGSERVRAELLEVLGRLQA
jgi:chromate reductase, NAD(P)H dehydrogenase (quinone)